MTCPKCGKNTISVYYDRKTKQWVCFDCQEDL